jgi:hypothetical protein
MGSVPATPVLLLQRDQIAVGVDPGAGAGMVQQQQRQQTTDLWIVRGQLAQQPPEPDRLGGQVDPEQPVAAGGVIALVEDQVHDRADGPDPVGELVVGWEPERDSCHGDLAFGPDQPLLQGPLGNQKGPGDLGRGQPANRPQGQGDLGIDPQRRMAAHQDQRQLVVVAAARWLSVVQAGLAVDRLQPGQQLRPLGPSPIPAQPVDRASAGGGDQPGVRMVRDAVARPGSEGLLGGVLDGVLGQLDIAGPTAQHRYGACPVGAVGGRDLVAHHDDQRVSRMCREGSHAWLAVTDWRISLARQPSSACRRRRSRAASFGT